MIAIGLLLLAIGAFSLNVARQNSRLYDAGAFIALAGLCLMFAGLLSWLWRVAP